MKVIPFKACNIIIKRKIFPKKPFFSSISFLVTIILLFKSDKLKTEQPILFNKVKGNYIFHYFNIKKFQLYSLLEQIFSKICFSYF